MDTFEAERKYRCTHDRLRDRLDVVGFEHQAHLEQLDTYYDHPQRSYAVTDEAVRLREITTADSDEPRVELTYKGPQVGDRAKTRNEVTVSVDSFSAMDTILQVNGFNPVGTVAKNRARYRRDNTIVTLDVVDSLGEFVEIERLVAAEHIEAAESGIDAVATELGLTEEMAVTATYLDLLLDDSQ